MSDSSRRVVALFVMKNSVYFDLENVECWDEERDARLWGGGLPVVAHPPCRAWSRLRHFSKAPAEEKDLALLAVELVRTWGGVLEHPSGSRLWEAAKLPLPGGETRDSAGGWSLAVSQRWWGHRAEKRTWLYVVGLSPAALPSYPLTLGRADYTIGSRRRDCAGRALGEISKAERIATPPAFARWLVEVARLARP